MVVGVSAFVAIVFGSVPPARASSVSAVTAPTLSSTAAGATGVAYTGIGFNLSPTGALTAASTITLTAPPGTTLTGGCDTFVHDDTTGANVGCGGSVSGGGSVVALDLSTSVAAGDHLSITLRRVTNPAPGTYSLSV
ncbi:MAG: hypothetical protein QOI99_134, partial [Actinomycetota bacterium]|nr:hypothetical protein [Actinomycetota bacterium]